MGARGGSVARVMLDSPLPQLDRLFDYSIPAEMAEQCQPGVRVKVPLRSLGRMAEGIVVEVADRQEYEGTLSPVEAVISSVPVLSAEVWQLARAVADRAAGTASDIIRLAIPRRMVRAEKAWLARPETVPSPITPVSVQGYAPEMLSALVAERQRLAVAAIPSLVPVHAATAQSPDEAPVWVGHWATLAAAAATQALAREESAIIVVPDHRDQDQVLAALAALVPPDRVIRVDSRQTDQERYASHLRAMGGPAAVIVGNRSAVYAPANRLGLLVLWNDADPLHREPLAPYVHSRDAALVRQTQQECALMVLSHVRSVDAQRLVEMGWLTPGAPLRHAHPKVIPTVAQAQSGDSRARIPSGAWRAAREALDHGPVLVQVARPGYVPQLTCAGCGDAALCTTCRGPLRVRAAGSTPSCTLCGALAAAWRCETCEGSRLRMSVRGSERTAEELGRAFPGARVVVADGERTVTSVDASPALVVATRGAEPIADGGYRAVLLLDGERMIARESLSVGLDCLRWWSHAASLAAPGASCMLVGVGGALASSMVSWHFDEYVARELADRRALRFPPAVRTASVTGSAEAVRDALDSLPQGEAIDVLGPAPHEDGVRAIVRFEYALGTEVARLLRTAVVKAATKRPRRVPPSQDRRATPLRLRVRFDDPEPFD